MTTPEIDESIKTPAEIEALVETETRKRVAEIVSRLPRALVRLAGVEGREERASLENCRDRSAVEALSSWLTTGTEPFFLVRGECGRGKTWLASAAIVDTILEDFASGRPGSAWESPALFVSVDDFVCQVQACYGHPDRDTEDVLAKYRRSRLLAIDDLGRSTLTADALRWVERLVDSRWRREDGKTIITTTRRIHDDPAKTDSDSIAARMGRHLASRLSESRRVTLTGPDYRRRE